MDNIIEARELQIERKHFYVELRENERGRLPSSTTPQDLEVNLNTSGNFNDTNVNKKSLSLNVRSAKGLEIVKRLIAVSGIGPRLARVILSGMPPDDLLDRARRALQLDAVIALQEREHLQPGLDEHRPELSNLSRPGRDRLAIAALERADPPVLPSRGRGRADPDGRTAGARRREGGHAGRLLLRDLRGQLGVDDRFEGVEGHGPDQPLPVDEERWRRL